MQQSSSANRGSYTNGNFLLIFSVNINNKQIFRTNIFTNLWTTVVFSGTPLSGTSERSGWGSRRMNKQTKIELLEAQQALQSEIRAKQQLMEELKNTRSAYLATKQRLDEAENRVSHFYT